ncbi:tRNA(Met) cytidine acetyltransferase TmcA [Thiomicrorhabdus sediminis]|nr:GNAT family N-acetyltransferase [Thiomicrorhabdus sediminis]
MNDSITNLNSLRQQLNKQQHRALVIISGADGWHQQQLEDVFANHETVFWVETQDEPNNPIDPAKIYGDFEVVASKRLKYHLGQEIDGAIINVSHGLSADTLGIVSGMIRAGGLLILLAPPEKIWLGQTNPEDQRFLNTPYTLEQANNGFSQHLINSWQHSDVIWLHENQLIEWPQTSSTAAPVMPLPSDDQKQAIAAIHSVAFGHRKRPLVLSADRGRGKSSALGLAAVDCLLDGKNHIVITASRLDQTKAAFQHAAESLYTLLEQGLDIELVVNKTGHIEFRYEHQTKQIEFVAPDYLILNPSHTDVVLVDEAAQLPTPLLKELLMRYHRMVFATTLHGYEGSGRGFELRFKKLLHKHTPDWKSLHLEQSIRWATKDPLETAINRALLLDIDLINSDSEKQDINIETLQIKALRTEQLLTNQAVLQSLFSLLVQAHYQTSPNDLQQILNAPNIELFVARKPGEDKVIGAVLCVEEGRLNPSKNRAHGHLVPQLLTKNYAQDDFLMLSTWRIMRIAVDPRYQHQGIGQKMIRHVETEALRRRIDYISSSFGANEALLPFWFKQHFWPLHVGAKRDKASGCHNLVVTKPVSAMSRQALSQIQSCFQEQFPHLLLESLPNLPPQQAWQIIQTFRFKQQNSGLEKVLLMYQKGERPYEAISHTMWQWSLQSAQLLLQASEQEQGIWCDKIMKKFSWQDVAHKYHLAGRKGVEQALQKMISGWLQQKRLPIQTSEKIKRFC